MEFGPKWQVGAGLPTKLRLKSRFEIGFESKARLAVSSTSNLTQFPDLEIPNSSRFQLRLELASSQACLKHPIHLW
jgi:hypothetical protein